jgi:hypothetical protein
MRFPVCPHCGITMQLVSREPIDAGFEMLHLQCTDCREIAQTGVLIEDHEHPGVMTSANAPRPASSFAF